MPAKVGFAVESAFGLVDPTTGLPAPGSASYRSFRTMMSEVTPTGEAPVNEDDSTRDGPHGLPPVPDTDEDDGQAVRRRTGQITLTLPWEFRGTDEGDLDDLALYALLRSGLAEGLEPGAASDDIAEAGTANRLTATSAAAYQGGGLIATRVAGVVEGACVTHVDSDTKLVRYSPSTAAALPQGQTVRMCRSLYIPGGPYTGVLGSSIALLREADAMREYATGCRWSRAALSITGGRVKWALTMDAAHIEDGDPSTAVLGNPQLWGGGEAHHRRCRVLLSSAPSPVSGADPAELTRLPLDVDVETIELSMENTYSARGRSSTLLGMSDWELEERNCELSMTLSTTDTDLDGDFWARHHRQLLLTFGPLGGRRGGVIYAPSVFLKSWSGGGRVRTGRRAKQRLVLGFGRGAGDIAAPGCVQNIPANSMLRIGWVL